MQFSVDFNWGRGQHVKIYIDIYLFDYLSGDSKYHLSRNAFLCLFTLWRACWLWNSFTLFELAHALRLYLGPRGEALWWWRCLGSGRLIALFGWGFPYHNWEKKKKKKGGKKCFCGTRPTFFSVTKRFLNPSRAMLHFYSAITVKRERHFAVVITALPLLLLCTHSNIITLC